jgi:ribulose-5-phosphate 4-epimerase/fuculose-1-phosphate aldolase
MSPAELESRTLLVLANHILANTGVLDAFGHVSVRHPDRPGHFLLSCSKAPELVKHEDILEYNLDSVVVGGAKAAQYSERFIHSEIYRARPDVQAICHHHSPTVMPFCVAGVPIVPVYQHGALIGKHVPLWDSQEAFGDTNLLITNPEQGASLADALGAASMVLMRHHGATVVGARLKELVFRAVSACKNADYQYRAMSIGIVTGLSDGEIERAANVPPTAIDRAWDLWAGDAQK